MAETQAEAQAQYCGRVLVADDEPSLLAAVRDLLTDEGYQVEVAIDGVSALQKIESFAPDVVLLDINMPPPDGIAVCRRLRAEKATELLPIVFITGIEDRLTKLECIEAGCSDFIIKPIDTAQLIARVRWLTHFKHLIDQLATVEKVAQNLILVLSKKEGVRLIRS